MKDAQKEYDTLVEIMEDTGEAKASKMFGMPCIKNNKGKDFAGYYNGDATFKLPQNIIQQWLGNKGAKLFDPMGSRPMKEWLQLSAEHASHWPELAKEAMKYVKESGERRA